MKKNTRFLPVYGLIMLLLALSRTGFAQTAEPRITRNINSQWKFTKGDIKGAEQVSYNDSAWESAGLPHSFSMPYFMAKDFYVGYGWYRRHLSLAETGKGRKTYLDFEGVFQVAEIYLNGSFVAKHEGGYTGFLVDISDFIKKGDNILAVRVNNIWQSGLAPRAGEHVFSGGIYRDVRLIQTNRIHIDWCGSSITTPVVSEKKAEVHVTTEIANHTGAAANIMVKTYIVDPSGKQAGSVTTTQKLTSAPVYALTRKLPVISNPQLWHPDHPFLYKAVSLIYQNGKLIDKETTEFGIRSIKWTADQGFFINGKHLYLLGANVHQDHAGWGDAVTNAGFYRDVQLIKNAGFNMIRGSHYPHDPAFAAACDKAGILFWSENNFWGIGGSDKTPEGYWNASAYPTHHTDTTAFAASLTQQLREMIKINRNHPSIIAWSVSNEPFFTAAETVPFMRRLVKKLVDVARAADPTRMVAVGGAQRPIDGNRIDLLGDIAGYNGDGATIDLFQKPGVPSMVSEYGSVTADRPGEYSPGWGDLSRTEGKAVYAWRSGQAIWCGFDHGSIAGSELGKMGIIDYFRIPKRSWYWYRKQYRNIDPPVWPVHGTPYAIRLEADKTTAVTDGTDDVWLKVTIVDKTNTPLSNSPDVKLEVVSGPGEFPTGRNIHFSATSDVRILDGQAAIELRAWQSGRTIIKATSPGLKPAELAIRFTGSEPYKGTPDQLAANRPYRRFVPENQDRKLQQFGRFNPTFASSSATGHTNGNAADGNVNTWWKPDANDRNPSLILDTEKKLVLRQINLTFPGADNYPFRIYVSDDKKSWKLIGDFTASITTEPYRVIDAANEQARFIRLAFIDPVKAALAEIEVSGSVVE